MLRAYGAEVVITPTAVEPDSPESYYSVSSRLAEEIPGGFKPDQYSNMANPEAHYRMTAPEIWEQTDGGEIDALVISVGTGGTITGVGRYFKERNPERADRRRRPRGLDLHGQGRERPAPVPRRGHRQGHLAADDGPDGRRRVGARLRPRLVPDRAAARARGGPAGRRLRRHDGVGGARGRGAARAGCAGADDAPRLAAARTSRSSSTTTGCSSTASSSGSAPLPTVAELLRSKRVEEADVPALVTISAHQKVGEAIDVMQRYSISQLAGRPRRGGRLARRRDRLAPGPRPARPRLQERGRAARGRRRRDAAAARDRRRRDSSDEIVTTLTGRTNAVVVARGRPAGRRGHALRPARVPRAQPQRLASSGPVTLSG